jgi:hypothetical protein
MKTTLLLLLFTAIISSTAFGQITTPIAKANFGVDGELRTNWKGNASDAESDDWFFMAGTSGTGKPVIDSSGAAAILASYAKNVSARSQSFIRRMNFPIFSTVNNQLLLDAAFIRDFHGNDSTVFASGSNKNGDSPGDWSCPVSQPIPDKNDILDMMVHLRRAGTRNTDSLWLFGGISLDNITGNRYFDFELYQTNLAYNRADRKFTGFGPHGGHTSWEFDAAGNVTKPGDVIFSAEYQSSSLTFVEARIWVNRSALNLVPAAFDWSGKFDGAFSGATYGYASIKPKTNGGYYTGLQSSDNTWGGPFGIVLQNESLATEYQARQYAEFSVNLTQLGLDPVSLFGSSSCNLPCRSILAKTRSSASFTAELKDFVMPLAFFSPPPVKVQTSTSYLCDKLTIAEIAVTNPVTTSIYRWSTDDGNILSELTGTTVYVDKPGTYNVEQFLRVECVNNSMDSIKLLPLTFCQALSANKVLDFGGTMNANGVSLKWKVQDNQQAKTFDIQKSGDGTNFRSIGEVSKTNAAFSNAGYSFQDDAAKTKAGASFYRIELTNNDGSKLYSDILRLEQTSTNENGFRVFPNPLKDKLFLQLVSLKMTSANVSLYNMIGNKLFSVTRQVKEGANSLIFDEFSNLPNGYYILMVQSGGRTMSQKITVSK